MSDARHCRALLISAPASGQGKTTVTAALARRALRAGLRVRVFKTGPDFIDPMLLERASGHVVHQLDLWMGGETHCRALLFDAAGEADLILVEGVMGLYDGDPSSADLAERFGIPVLAVIDGAAMAQTFGALALGLSRYRESLPFHGVIANRIGGARHAQMLAESLRPPLHWLGALPRDAALALPKRHLGLVQANEIADIDARIDAAADAFGEAVDFDAIPHIEFSSPAGEGHSQGTTPLLGKRIAIARDAAFSFLYPANLDTLRTLGAELTFFSPLNDAALPESVDAIYLPGGYPELHAAQWSTNTAMHDALRAHHAANRPMLAECGGMMALFDALTDIDGRRHAMAGLLRGETTMQKRLAALGMQQVALPEGTLRGHSFHYSKLSTELTPLAQAVSPRTGGISEGVYRSGRLTASYVHFYFPSNPSAVAACFGA